jgi:hypothetical protein
MVYTYIDILLQLMLPFVLLCLGMGLYGLENLSLAAHV